jgi:hypothetical protein
MAKQQTLWAFDCETDPFKPGRVPVPFAWGATCETGEFFYWWGDNATKQFMAFLMELDEGLFVGHNAGRFDSIFIKDIIAGNMLMVDERIVKCKAGNVEIRDSYAILPMELKKLGAKFEIDYKKLERPVHESHKAEILHYLKQDCAVLLEVVQGFYARAGKRRLTIASHASAELRAIYPELPKLNDAHHRDFSPFFYGGRVQAFEKGIISGQFSLYDVNSMYPSVMTYRQHPYGKTYSRQPFSVKTMPDNDCGFFYGTCDTLGALPVRQKNKTTPYLHGRYEVACTLHELRAGLECDLIRNVSGTMLLPETTTNFSAFILPHYDKRLKAKAEKNEQGLLYHKLIPNSSYGRFAMSPDGRDECYYAKPGEDISTLKDKGWKVGEIDLDAGRYVLKRPVTRPWMFYEDVAMGASITGAARAVLLRAIAKSRRVLYCDTDSLLCEELGAEVHDDTLGAWKHELDCDTAAIAGKKMYVLLKNKRPVKHACKGVKACPSQIYEAADGDEVEIVRDAPTLRLLSAKFTNRIIRRT